MEVTNSELCKPCQEMYSSKQQLTDEYLNLEVSETTVAKQHTFLVDELEVVSDKKERVAISTYLCEKHHYTQVENIICHLKTPQWQRIIILERLLSSGKCKPVVCDENDPHIAALCKQVIKKLDLLIQKPPKHN